MRKDNTFAGGVDGVAITAANSGGASGDPFNNVIGSQWLYENSDGVPSITAVNPLDSSYCEYTGLGSLTAITFLRFYVFLPALPTIAHWVPGAYVNTGVSAVFAPFLFGMDQRLYDAGTVSGLIYALNQWIRIESGVTPSTSGAGTSEYRYYANPDADVNSWTTRTQRSGLTMGIADIDRYRFVGGAGAANSTVSPRVKGLAVSSVDWIGPAPPPPTIVGVPATPFW